MGGWRGRGVWAGRWGVLRERMRRVRACLTRGSKSIGRCRKLDVRASSLSHLQTRQRKRAVRRMLDQINTR